MQITDSYFEPLNVELCSRYIVYLKQEKFDGNIAQSRKLVSNTSKILNKEIVNGIFKDSRRVGVISKSEKFLDFYEPEEIIKQSSNLLKNIYAKDGQSLIILENEEVDELPLLISFCVERLNDLILINLDSGKTFISKNSYYLTNSVLDIEAQNFPVTWINDDEILKRLDVQFNESLVEYN